MQPQLLGEPMLNEDYRGAPSPENNALLASSEGNKLNLEERLVLSEVNPLHKIDKSAKAAGTCDAYLTRR